MLTGTLSSAEAPAGYPHQNINNRKNRKRGGRWEEGNGGSLSSLFPLPIVPRALFFFLPSLPTTQRGLWFRKFMTGSFRLRIGIISVVIGGHFGGGDHFDGGDHFGGGTSPPGNF